MAVCLVGMLFLAAQMFSQSYNTYLFNYYFNAPSLSMMPTVCQYLPVAVSYTHLDVYKRQVVMVVRILSRYA